jgi:hypothetical protein
MKYYLEGSIRDLEIKLDKTIRNESNDNDYNELVSDAITLCDVVNDEVTRSYKEELISATESWDSVATGVKTGLKKAWEFVIKVISKIVEYIKRTFNFAKRNLIYNYGCTVFGKLMSIEASLESKRYDVVRVISPTPTGQVIELSPHIAGDTVSAGQTLYLPTPSNRRYNDASDLSAELNQRILLLQHLSGNVSGLATALIHAYKLMNMAVANVEKLVVNARTLDIVNAVGRRSVSATAKSSVAGKVVLHDFYWDVAENTFMIPSIDELIHDFEYIFGSMINKQGAITVPTAQNGVTNHIKSIITKTSCLAITGYDPVNGFDVDSHCFLDLNTVADYWKNYYGGPNGRHQNVPRSTITFSHVGIQNTTKAYQTMQVYSRASNAMAKLDSASSTALGVAQVIHKRLVII